MEVHPLDGGEVRVDEDGIDGQRFGLAPLGGLVSASALDAQLHLEGAVLVEVGQHHVGGQDLDIGVGLEVARGDRARPLRLEPQQFGPSHADREDQLPQVHDDVERVFVDALQVRELVEHALDLDPGRHGSRNRGQEHPTVGVAHRDGEARLEGLDRDLAVRAFARRPLVADGKDQLIHRKPPGDTSWGNWRAASPEVDYYSRNPASTKPAAAV